MTASLCYLRKAAAAQRCECPNSPEHGSPFRTPPKAEGFGSWGQANSAEKKKKLHEYAVLACTALCPRRERDEE